MATVQMFEVTFKFHALQVCSAENAQVRYTVILLFVLQGSVLFLTLAKSKWCNLRILSCPKRVYPV
jgi:hypothetical protein